MTDTGSFTQLLSEARTLALVGGKGANLGELLRAGFDVPDGFVVTTAAYDRFVADNHLAEQIQARAEQDDIAGINELFDGGAIGPDLAAAITGAYAGMGAGPVAVRSSATAEDLPEASFAGQQETFLNVIGADAVLVAVRRCWASLWTERAIAYRATRAEAAGRLSIAVVVQQLAPAEVSGVLFTANPANGRRDEAVITSAWGLGESVVGGTVDTDTYVVRTDGAVQVTLGAKAVMTVPTESGSAEVATPADRRGQPSLTNTQAGELTEVGREVAAHFGVPQDIEWVRHDGRFRLVQARPITALPEPVGEMPTEWAPPRRGSLYFRASIVEQMPDPLTPLFADMVRTAVPQGLDSLFDDLGGLGPFDVDFPTINGYAFYDYGGRAFVRMMFLAPALLTLLFKKGLVVRRWGDQELPRYQATVQGWSDRDPATLTAVELLAGVQELLDAGCRYYTSVQMVIPMASTGELTWTGLYDRVLRRAGDPQATEFLLGFDSAPIRAEKSLFELGRWCQQDDALTETLRSPETDALADVPPEGVAAQRWADWRARLDGHLAAYGYTIYNLDWINPVPADDPAPVLAALRHVLSGAATDPAERQQRAADRRVRLTEALFDRLDPARRALARKVLNFAQTWAPIREDALAAMGLAWPMLRRLLRELGRRLAATGSLDDPADVFWLRSEEARRLAADADAGRRSEGPSTLVAERWTVWRGQSLATPPQYLPQSRLMRSMEGMLPAREQEDGLVLTGVTGSGGSVRAPARVLSGPADFGAFQAGEVLVASITTPAYTPLFAMAAAVVTDIGGVLSHGSIVAREYGIPAVLGTGVATKRIRTGDELTVDGTRGQVLLPGAEPQSAALATENKGSSRAVAVLAGAGVLGLAVWTVTAARRRRRSRV